MPTSDPQLPSPLDAGGLRADRRLNASPPPAQSKRDKRRQLLADRISTLSEQFARDRDLSYREKLQTIQIDTNLIMKVDPYADRPLDFLAPTRREREQAVGLDAADQDGQGGQGGTRSLLEMAGPTFHEWYQRVEDLVEERDYELAKQKNDFEEKRREHGNMLVYKTEVATREHDALAATLRDRLMNSVAAKKHRIMKEKEAVDIADGSALLLHPNQFSLNNPASPGGSHNKRATRLRQNADEISAAAESRKRKKNAADDDGSPAPQRRAVDANGTTPFWQGDRLARRNVTGPTYSIDKLFTDKELAMTYNAAALAALRDLQRNKVKTNGSGDGASSPSDGESGADDGNQDGADPTPSAVMMERVPSHATRSTRGGAGSNQHQNFLDDKIVGMEALTNFEMPGNLEKMVASEPKLPPMFTSTYAKPHAKAEANTPASLPLDEINSDLVAMKMLQQYESIHGVGSNLDNVNGSRRVLEAAAFRAKDNRYVAFLHHEKRDPELLRKDLALPATYSSVRDDPVTPSGSAAAHAITAPTNAAAGGTPMSRQSSQGGAAMSRQGSNTRAQRKRNQ